MDGDKDMYNKKSWTDKDLSVPREEWGKETASLQNTAASHYNSEHYYNEKGDKPVILAPSSVPGYESSEHFYNEGIKTSIAYNINGKSVSDAIISGELTKENISNSDKEVICNDILCGVTRNKDILAAKLDLLIEDKRLIESILLIQYNEALKEINREKRSGNSTDVVDRKFQFLVTSKILMEKGYELDKLSFVSDDSKDFAEMLNNFRIQSSGSKLMDDASWFKDGVAPEGYDFRKVKSPFLFSGSLLGELYQKNPDLFKEKYEDYKNTTSMEPVSFEEFMERYGVFGDSIKLPEISSMNM